MGDYNNPAFLPDNLFTENVTATVHLNSENTRNEMTISSLLRYENHADVYSLGNPKDSSKVYEGHLFFNETSPDHWGRYEFRKRKRLRESKLFFGEATCGKRTMVVIASPRHQGFVLKLTRTEFPPLPNIGAGMYCLMPPICDAHFTHIGCLGLKPKIPRPKKLKRSYATVLKEGSSERKAQKMIVLSNHRAYESWENRNRQRKGLEPKKKACVDSKTTQPVMVELVENRSQEARQTDRAYSSTNRFAPLDIAALVF
jgi:hypothetical protein